MSAPSEQAAPRASRMTEEESKSLVRPRPLEESQICKFYREKSVLITGASGFVGKLLVEKLLRACPEVDRIYVLIRSKKNKNPDERLKQLLDSPIFDGIRAQAKSSDGLGKPDWLFDKVVAIEGDITRPLLGLTGSNLELLIQNVDVVLHSAAVVGFEQPLKKAIESNLIGVYNSIQLCLQLKKLVGMVYVSTAYSNCHLSSELDEHIYPVNVDPATLVALTTSFDQDTLELIKSSLIGKHPNTYTYTKSLAEWLCGQYVGRLPIVICRPSVVGPAWREPIPGYLDNMNASCGIYTLVSKGLVESALGASSKSMDHIPVDTVVNCIIALGWFAHLYHAGHRLKSIQVDPAVGENLHQFYETTKRKVLLKGIDLNAANLPVFHCSSGAENYLRQGKANELFLKYSLEYPMPELFGCPNFSYTTSKCWYSIKKLLVHQFPAYMSDLVANFAGQGRNVNMVRNYTRIENFFAVLAYFTMSQWKFSPENRLQLLNNFMSDEDKRLFNCDAKSIDWDTYFCNFALGTRRFMSKWPDEPLETSRRRLRMIHCRNSLIQLIGLIGACYVTFVCYNLTCS